MGGRVGVEGLSGLVGPPGRRTVVEGAWFDRWAAVVGSVAAKAGLALDPVELLVERARLFGHQGWGSISAGGSCRIMRADDGWLAVNLPRDDDVAAVPAWLEQPVVGDVWTTLAAVVPTRGWEEWCRRAGWLGLPVGPVPLGWTTPDEQRSSRGLGWPPVPGEDPIVAISPSPSAPPRHKREHPLVVDLSALWAGPLCGAVLAAAGAEVHKVESRSRPDGARLGTPAFYDRLNRDKLLVELDLHTEAGRGELARLVAAADVVIEGSRPRALIQLGIDATTAVDRGAVWTSITAYGRNGPWADRVGFGDDVAAAGGLVHVPPSEPHAAPWFIGDAAGDPIAGITAAARTLACLQRGEAALLDVAMRDCVLALTGGGPIPAAPPGGIVA